MSSEGPKVAGHSATLVGDDMFVIGGYDRIMGYSERSYKYNIVTKKWTNLAATGPSPKGLYLCVTSSGRSRPSAKGGGGRF